jgi:hypothetical protein
VNRSLLLDDSTLGILGIRLGSLLAHIHALYNSTLLLGIYLQDFTLLAFAITCIDVNNVPFLDM